ncbi:MAG: hypothetical protein K9M96_10750 [Deltaproteobacteria bacterium]|nr:hypothetical protein [Deltaproteobacteria bacterium]
MKTEAAAVIKPGQTWEVDLFRPEDAEGVARLFLRVYGEDYPIRTYVEPKRLIAENRNGTIISSVARTQKGDVVGHNALFRMPPYERIYESGAGVVHTDYRGGKGIFTRLAAHGQEVAARQFDVEAIYGEPLLSHVFSQKMCHTLGWITHAVEVNLMPEAAYEKEKGAAGRVSVLLDVKTIVSHPHPVHLPSAYLDVLAFLYQGLDDDRELLPAEEELPSDVKTRIQVQAFDFARAARVTVHAAGADLGLVVDTLEADLNQRGIEVIQIWLNLNWPWIGAAVDILRTKQFFLGGLLPRWFNTDGLLMQKVTGAPQWENLHIHFERAKTLVQMVKDDWREVGGSR